MKWPHILFGNFIKLVCRLWTTHLAYHKSEKHFFFSRLVSMLWSKLSNWPKFECEVKKTVKMKNAVEINIMVLGKTQQKWNCSVKFLFQTCGQFWPFGAVFTAWKAYTKNRWVGSWDCPLALWQISSNTYRVFYGLP